MKIVLDTNVIISGIFFSGAPNKILKVWRAGKLDLVVSKSIMNEYSRVAGILRKRFPAVDIEAILELIELGAENVYPSPLPAPVCEDPDDDKFLECALAGKAGFIISGDKLLLKTSGYRGIHVVTPRSFVNNFLENA